MHIERWKWIPGYEGRYAVSNVGRIRSHAQKRVKFLKPGKMPGGHLSVSLGKNNSQCVHKLVLSAFDGPPKNGQECRHLDGNPANNNLINLRWGTRAENNADKKWHTKACKFTLEQIRHVKENRGIISARVLSAWHGMSIRSVYAIWQGKYHKDV